MKNVSVPGSMTIFTVIFQFLDESVLFKKVTDFSGHQEYVAKFAPLETWRQNQNCSMGFLFIPKQLLYQSFPSPCKLFIDEGF